MRVVPSRFLPVSLLCMALLVSGCSVGGGQTVAMRDCRSFGQMMDDVTAAYSRTASSAADAWRFAHERAQNTLKSCLAAIRPDAACAESWNAVLSTYESAMGDIANDVSYVRYAAAHKNWNDCRAAGESPRDAHVPGAIAACGDAFLSAIEAGDTAYDEASAVAEADRASSLRDLEAVRVRCETAMSSGTVLSSSSSALPDGGPCAIPDVEGDFGPADIALTILNAVAEKITRTPETAGDRLFAAIIVGRIRTRVAQMTIQAADAADAPVLVRLLERKVKKYEDALHAWSKIAEGRPPADLASRIRVITSGASVFCTAPGS